jgi:Tol biopolymer transport system component
METVTDFKSTAVPFLRTPALAPDGNLIAFRYAADIWLVEAGGGVAERLTAHPSTSMRPRFAPDGRQIAFTSNRTGSGDVYVMPLGGGDVKRLTFHERYCAVEDWSTDGRRVYYSSDRERRGWSLYAATLSENSPVELYAEPYEQLQHAAAAPDGRTLAFNLVRRAWWRSGPTPFAPDEIWLGPAHPGDEAPIRRLIGGEYRGMNRWPLWAPDGSGLYFVSDRDGAENLWFQPLDGDLEQITHFRDGRLLWPAIARHSGMIVFEHDWQIWRLDPASRETAPVPIQVRPDSRVTPLRTELWHRGFSELELAPDGKKLAFIARGELFADFADKETDRDLRQGNSFALVRSGARERDLCWTPDSRSLIYLSDRHGEEEIYRFDFHSRQEIRLTHDQRPRSRPRCAPNGKLVAYVRDQSSIDLLDLESGTLRSFAQGNFVWLNELAWSPDSRWLAYISHDDRWFGNVYVKHIEADEAQQVSFLSNISGGDLLWAPNGRFLVFSTSQYRMESQIVRIDLVPPEPVFREAEFDKLFEDRRNEEAAGAKVEEGEKPELPIVFSGIQRRLRLLTPIQMDASAAAISPDSNNLLFLASVAGKINIWSLALDEPRQDQPPRQLTASNSYKSAVQFTPDGKAFFYIDDGQVMSRKFPAGNDPQMIPIRGEVQVDFQAEKQQMFSEVWRMLRDSFYDPTFRGLDWAAVRDRYAPLIAGAQTGEELHTLLNLMTGELRASHLGVFGWSGGAGSDGYLGLRFDARELYEQGRHRVSELLLDGPAAQAGEPPRPGEYLVAVEDRPLDDGTSLDRLLQRSAGRRLRLRLANEPAAAETREVVIRPLDSNAYAGLVYRAWVVANEDYVHRISEQRLGYVHIPEMSYGAYQQFLADLDTEALGKDGIVLDVRYNSGGHTATFLLDILMRPNLLLSGFRNSTPIDSGHLSGNRVLNRPTILVTNELSSSNTEMFAESYRRLGLGRIVGRPTAGAVIWTTHRRLLDGYAVRLPRFFVHTPEGQDLEGQGRPVDIEQERLLGEWRRSEDNQLAVAVATLLEQLDKESQ